MSLVFISYRRRDTLSDVRVIRNKLQSYFGENSVFLDESTIEKGKDWKIQIDQAIGSCEVVLAVIGEHWNRDNFANDDDMVRYEIGTALRVGKAIIPVVLNGTKFPNEEQLPADMRGLTRYQGTAINTRNSEQYIDDTLALIKAIQLLASPSGTIVIKRADQMVAALGDVQVFLNNQLIAGLRPGDVKLKNVPPGDYEIYGTMTTALLRAARTTTIRFRVLYQAKTFFLFRYDYWAIDPLIRKENSLLKIEQKE